MKVQTRKSPFQICTATPGVFHLAVLVCKASIRVRAPSKQLPQWTLALGRLMRAREWSLLMEGFPIWSWNNRAILSIHFKNHFNLDVQLLYFCKPEFVQASSGCEKTLICRFIRWRYEMGVRTRKLPEFNAPFKTSNIHKSEEYIHPPVVLCKIDFNVE